MESKKSEETQKTSPKGSIPLFEMLPSPLPIPNHLPEEAKE